MKQKVEMGKDSMHLNNLDCITECPYITWYNHNVSRVAWEGVSSNILYRPHRSHLHLHRLRRRHLSQHPRGRGWESGAVFVRAG